MGEKRMAIAVDVMDLSKRYGYRWALKDVTLSVPSGGSLGLVGPNGAGKSTLLRTLLGLARPSKGNAWLNQIPVWPRPERALAEVGGFVDFPRVYPHMTALENLSLWADLTGQPRRRAFEALPLVHLKEHANRRVVEYSHGMRQRLGLAVALLKRPSLIVLDEPRDGLDPARQEEMRGVIEMIRNELGSTFIMSSHVIQDVERLCEQIAVFDAGQLRFFGRPALLGASQDEEIIWEARPLTRALGCLQDLGIWAHVTRDGRLAGCLNANRDLASVNALMVKRGVLIHTVERRQSSLETRLLRYLEDGHVQVR